MARLVADIESDGLLDTITRVWCIHTLDVDTGEERGFGPDKILAGLDYLQSADELILHNGIGFDLPALRKVYPHFNVDGIKIFDTLVASRLIEADLRNSDFSRGIPTGQFPKRLYGSHSLGAWGLRLGMAKGEYSDWTAWTPEMSEYCALDCRITHELWKALAPHKWSQKSLELEHRLAEICFRIGNAGWHFNTSAAGELYATLAQERADLEQELKELFPPWTVEEEFIPARNNKTRGYIAGELFVKTKTVEFNPSSRRHIEFCLREKYKWKPKVFTPSGEAKIDETILKSLPFPEAKKLAHSFLLQKRIGQLAEGNAAWLKLVDGDDKLRHTINSNGTLTGRASHFGPNLAQVPANRAPYGEQCRELFGVPPGYSLVGTDLSGLELRCLAHFLDDGGAYGREVIGGDVHTANQQAAGLPDRPTAKTFIYGWLYGAGDAKLGSIVGKGAAEGKRLREKFLAANPALAALLRAVKAAVKSRGHLIGLDGRKLYIRSEHAALNTLLQSAGAIICKTWLELVDTEIRESGLDAQILLWCHDELQIQVKDTEANLVCDIARRCAAEAGRQWKFKVPIDADATIGTTWSNTH